MLTQSIEKSFFYREKAIEKNTEKRQILAQSIEKSFLVDPLNTNNAIYRDSLTLKVQSCKLKKH